MTKEWYEKLLSELNDLEESQLPQILKQIKEAREEWDLSENSDYHAAKDKQALLKNRVAKLKQMLHDVTIVEERETQTSHDSVWYGSKVTLSTETGDTYTVELVGTSEVSCDPLKISFSSPIWSAIEGKKKGDVVKAKLLSGKKNIEILEIA